MRGLRCSSPAPASCRYGASWLAWLSCSEPRADSEEAAGDRPWGYSREWRLDEEAASVGVTVPDEGNELASDMGFD